MVDIKNGCGKRTGTEGGNSAALVVSTVVIGTYCCVGGDSEAFSFYC